MAPRGRPSKRLFGAQTHSKSNSGRKASKGPAIKPAQVDDTEDSVLSDLAPSSGGTSDTRPRLASKKNVRQRGRQTLPPAKKSKYHFEEESATDHVPSPADEDPEDDEFQATELDSDHLDSTSSLDSYHPNPSLKIRPQASAKSVKKTTSGSLGHAVKLAKGPGKDELVPPGLIAPFTISFLEQLAIPQNNDREWLALNDKTYRRATDNWKEFIDLMVPTFRKLDWTLPKLPSKDLIYRVHRDVRFSNDKRPYKTYFSAGYSRTGRKGPWAGYYLELHPGGKSHVGGGVWAPEKDQLNTIRSSILSDSKPLRKVISSPQFTKVFGSPTNMGSKGEFPESRNIFACHDALKKCPKINGVDKTHPDVDLLKLKSIAAQKTFTDEVVLSKTFPEELEKAIQALVPLVQCINEMISPQSDNEAE